MNKVIFVGCETERQAYAGDRALHDMHEDGAITLYNDAVVVKDHDGKIAVREKPETSPVATLGGLLTGGLIGLLGGPVGAAVGAGAGTLVGAAFDLTRAGLDKDFVEDVGKQLKPGHAAVIAEIDEHWEAPLDARMEAIGGKLMRRTRTQIDDTYFARAIEASQKELASLENEKVAKVTAAQTEKARQDANRLQVKIDLAKSRLHEKEDELAAKIRSLDDESRKKIAVLEAQKATATAESKALLAERLADVRREYEGRSQRLRDLMDSRKGAHAESRF